MLVVVSLLGLCSGVAVVGFESPASASPAITSVVIGGTEAAPVVTVNGSGFGASAAALGTAYGIPAYCGGGSFSGDDYGTNFQFQDNAVPWSAGLGTGNFGDNCIGVDFTSYSDTQVVFTFGSYYYPNSAYQLLAGDPFTMNVLGATISGNVPTVVSAANPPVAATVTAEQDAVWSVAIVNPYSVSLTNVSATLHANANVTTPLVFDTAVMPGCSTGAGNSEVCTVANIPADTTTHLNVFVPTNGRQAGDTITGDITVSSDTLLANVSGSLGTVTIVSCGAACEKAVAAPGVPVSSSSSPPTVTDPTKQTVTLPVVANGPAVPVTLQSTTPVATETPLQKKLCPTAANQTHCSGQISTITASFGQYNNPAKPIRVTISAHWGHTIPPGRILMEKNTGGDPLFLLACAHNALTGVYNTPCLLAETHTGTSATNDLVTYDTVLFTSLDIQFARAGLDRPDQDQPTRRADRADGQPGVDQGGVDMESAYGDQRSRGHELRRHGPVRGSRQEDGHVRVTPRSPRASPVSSTAPVTRSRSRRATLRGPASRPARAQRSSSVPPRRPPNRPS